ncbi:MAG: hypothetical protein IKP37_10770, partial [Paludibacteraceae bacterium]|nr:hypothetical protein [Paludibacteraceae bacterium]
EPDRPDRGATAGAIRPHPFARAAVPLAGGVIGPPATRSARGRFGECRFLSKFVFHIIAKKVIRCAASTL